jgi:hypothetical protein
MKYHSQVEEARTMFKNWKEKLPVRIVTLGLNDSEKMFLKKHYENSPWEIISANTEMDLFGHADQEKCDLCIIGQSNAIQFPAYIAWLLKEIIKPSRMVVVTSNLSRQEARRLRKYRVRFVLNRPLDASRFTESIEKALNDYRPWPFPIITFFADLLHFNNPFVRFHTWNP